jgi:hypothetical protein
LLCIKINPRSCLISLSKALSELLLHCRPDRRPQRCPSASIVVEGHDKKYCRSQVATTLGFTILL